jgi:hypothetical protein
MVCEAALARAYNATGISTAFRRQPMAEGTRTREGYLVIADISGYTKFLTDTELEHAQSILEELTTLILSRLVPPLRMVKLEGDAVFCYSGPATFADAERLLELLEVCYFDFKSQLFDMERSTTCRCAACAHIGTLDLKFVAHYGRFVAQRLDGVDDVVGPDVILIHRLLKNTVAERTGIRAYALFTEPCRNRLPPSVSLLSHSEEYASFGVTTAGVFDLKQAADEMREAQSEYVGPDDADLQISVDLPVPPEAAWQHFVDPLKRLRWEVKASTDPDKIVPNMRGRVGAGAAAHCAHGPGPIIMHHYVDWRPYHYCTALTAPVRPSLLALPPFLETMEFVGREDGGTHAEYRMRVRSRGIIPMWRFRLAAPIVRSAFTKNFARLRDIIAVESATR